MTNAELLMQQNASTTEARGFPTLPSQAGCKKFKAAQSVQGNLLQKPSAPQLVSLASASSYQLADALLHLLGRVHGLHLDVAS